MNKGEESKALPQVSDIIHEGVSVLDIGCNNSKVVPWAFGVDISNTPSVSMVIGPQDIYWLHKSTILTGLHPDGWDVVFSSHVLEHLCHWKSALDSWFALVKKGGYLILYLPDGKRYDNRMNKVHVQDFCYGPFIENVTDLLTGEGEIIRSSIDPVPGYSFLVVIKKW
jgi:SAM-dependent methyltransferase